MRRPGALLAKLQWHHRSFGDRNGKKNNVATAQFVGVIFLGGGMDVRREISKKKTKNQKERESPTF